MQVTINANGNTTKLIHNSHPHIAMIKGYTNTAIPIAIIHLNIFVIVHLLSMQ